MPRIAAAIIGCWLLAQWPSMLLRKWTVQRCQGVPEDLPDRRAQALVAVGDAEPDTGQAAGSERPQELAPERFGLGLADVEADHFAPAGLVDGVGDHQALLAHPAAFADLLDLAVEPHVGVAALQRPFAERLDLLVQAAAQPRDLVLAHVHAHLLDQPVDLAGGDAVDVGLLDDRDQRLLRAPARLQKAREIRALTQLRDPQLQLTRARRPRALPVPVALRARDRC